MTNEFYQFTSTHIYSGMCFSLSLYGLWAIKDSRNPEARREDVR